MRLLRTKSPSCPIPPQSAVRRTGPRPRPRRYRNNVARRRWTSRVKSCVSAVPVTWSLTEGGACCAAVARSVGALDWLRIRHSPRFGPRECSCSSAALACRAQVKFVSQEASSSVPEAFGRPVIDRTTREETVTAARAHIRAGLLSSSCAPGPGRKGDTLASFACPRSIGFFMATSDGSYRHLLRSSKRGSAKLLR